MIRYVIKRIITIIPIILAIVFILFVMLYALPGSQIRRMPASGGGDVLDSIYTFFNAGDNFFTKYVRYCFNIIFYLDFGSSMSTYRLASEIPSYMRITLTVLATGGGAALVIGIPLGVYSAVHKNSKRDRVINAVSLFFSSIPSYALALVIALLFVLQLRIVPMVSFNDSPTVYIMPMVTIALGGIALIARMTRTSMLDVLDQPYITALRSKGLKEINIVYRHAFKNALVPVVSVLGVFVSQMLCGTFIVERFFNLHGLGLYMLRSLSVRDYFGILGCTVTITVFLALTNIAIDVVYAIINPQIRMRYMKTDRVKPEKEAVE